MKPDASNAKHHNTEVWQHVCCFSNPRCLGDARRVTHDAQGVNMAAPTHSSSLSGGGARIMRTIICIVLRTFPWRRITTSYLIPSQVALRPPCINRRFSRRRRWWRRRPLQRAAPPRRCRRGRSDGVHQRLRAPKWGRFQIDMHVEQVFLFEPVSIKSCCVTRTADS